MYQNGKDTRYSDEAYERFLKYQLEWKKKTSKQVHLHLNTDIDADVISWLDKRDNKTNYIRSLMLKDMAMCNHEGFDPNTLRLELDHGRAKSRLANGYGRKPTKSVLLHLHKVYDADVIEWLSTIENKQRYIICLVRADMELCKKTGIKPEYRIKD